MPKPSVARLLQLVLLGYFATKAYATPDSITVMPIRLGSYEGAALIDSLAQLDTRRELHVKSSECALSKFGFEYRLKIENAKEIKVLSSVSVLDGAPCNSFRYWYRPFFLNTALFNLDSNKFIPVVDVRRFARRSFGTDNIDVKFFYGDYLHTMAFELYVIIFNASFFESLECEQVAFWKFKTNKFHSCESEIYDKFNVIRIGSVLLILGNSSARIFELEARS
jgi:hypothetical protein